MTDNLSAATAALTMAAHFERICSEDEKMKKNLERITRDIHLAAEQVLTEYKQDFSPLYLLLAYSASSKRHVEAGGWTLPASSKAAE